MWENYHQQVELFNFIIFVSNTINRKIVFEKSNTLQICFQAQNEL
jgi:hypothetical protein